MTWLKTYLSYLSIATTYFFLIKKKREGAIPLMYVEIIVAKYYVFYFLRTLLEPTFLRRSIATVVRPPGGSVSQ